MKETTSSSSSSSPTKLWYNYYDKQLDGGQSILKSSHQQDYTHVKCSVCHLQFQSAGGMAIHVLRVHGNQNQTLAANARVQNAKAVNESTSHEALGRQGVTYGWEGLDKAYLEEEESQLTGREKRALEAVPGFKSNYPWFAVRIVKSHKHQLVLPFKFVNKYLPKRSMNATVLGPSGRTWNIWYKYKKGRSLLSTGWNSFWLSNALKEGDVCVYELIDDEKMNLKVSIGKKAN